MTSRMLGLLVTEIVHRVWPLTNGNISGSNNRGTNISTDLTNLTENEKKGVCYHCQLHLNNISPLLRTKSTLKTT